MIAQRRSKNYWSTVFDQAASLMDSGAARSGEAAFWLARKMVDQSPMPAEPQAPGPLFEACRDEHLAWAS